MTDNWGTWESLEEKQKEERSKDYFNIEEGDNRFVLLSHIAPLAQIWDGKKYRPAEEGEKGANIKGVCWVYQEKVIKSAKLPYTAVKAIKALRDNEDWEFSLPFPHVLTLNAKNAGSTEVKYSLTTSPKKVTIPKEIIEELKSKPTPEELVEMTKGKTTKKEINKEPEYPEEDIDPNNIPF